MMFVSKECHAMSVYQNRFPFVLALVTVLIFVLAGGILAWTGDDEELQGRERLGFAIETVSVELAGPLGGQIVTYTVTAGLTPILDDVGTERAQIFSTAYTINADEGEKRPVAFIFNGGPGASSIYLHMGGLAPRIARPIPNAGLDEPSHPFHVVDNSYSPLAVADLVFVDPVGTGFSRSIDPDTGLPLSPFDMEANALFWSLERDLGSLAEFIRTWLTENDRWGSRVFIIGESYGGLRAAALPSFLSRLGIATSGTVMVAPALAYTFLVQTFVDVDYDVAVLPTAVAIAHYHGLLADDLQKMSVEDLTDMAWRWARTEYRQALHEGNSLSGEQFQAVAKELSRLTSLPELEFTVRGLRFPYNFPELVLRKNHLIISPYDGRMTAPLSFVTQGEEDPLNRLANEYYHTNLMSFLQDTVGLKTLRPYLGINEAVLPNWDFMDGNHMGMPDSASILAMQMRRFPSLKVFMALGRYDLVCPPESTLAALNRMDIPKNRLANIETRIYDGGHMIYTNPEAARKLGRDLSAWMMPAVR